MTLNKYKCVWCNAQFEREVRKTTGEGISKKQAVSDQVRCPDCGNLIKTWEKK